MEPAPSTEIQDHLAKTMNTQGRPLLWTRLFPLVFGVCLFIPLIQTFFPFCPERVSDENRRLAEPPNLKQYPWRAFHQYFRDYEAFFNDHFGFRTTLTTWNSLIHLAYFSISTNPMVVMGKQGWMFLDNQGLGEGLKDYLGKAPYTSVQLETIRQNLTGLQQHYRNKGILFLVVIAPIKEVIYSEFVPDYLPKGRTRYDQIMDLCQQNHFDFVLGLKDPLLRAKAEYPYPLFYLTDTHWNHLGSYLGYRAIMSRLRQRLPALPMLTLDQASLAAHWVRQTKLKEEDPGDMPNLVNLNGHFSELMVTLAWKLPFRARLREPDHPVPPDSVRHALYVQDRPDLPRLVMVHDSFVLTLKPLFAESFSRSYFLWKNSFDVNQTSPERPQIVVWELNERFSDALFRVRLK